MWRWLFKPVRNVEAKTTKIEEKVEAVKKDLRQSDFDVRTHATNIMGGVLQNKDSINDVKGDVEKVDQKVEKLDDKLDKTVERVTRVESDVDHLKKG